MANTAHSCSSLTADQKQQVGSNVVGGSSHTTPAARLQHQNHHHHAATDSSTGKSQFRGHQRRQSVARLLPDISKLRLLSWLVEASSELINCDIAIMDGVYAKLNRSQESLLFWNAGTSGSSSASAAAASAAASAAIAANATNHYSISSSNNNPATANLSSLPNYSIGSHNKQRPALPSVQPVANNIVISQRRKMRLHNASTRNHHSLPLTNYDASSLAAVSLSSSLGPRSADSDSLVCSRVLSQRKSQQQQQQQTAAGSSSADIGATALPAQQVTTSGCDTNQVVTAVAAATTSHQDSCDSNQSDDDDNSSAASSTTSSGIHGGGTSLSSSTSTTSSCSSSSTSSAASTGSASEMLTNANHHKNNKHHHHHRNQQVVATEAEKVAAPMARSSCSANSAEQLSEKIRRTVIQHNYLQSLLVNIIRRHDRQRDLLNQQRRRQMSVDQCNLNQRQQQQRIDLADIADALDDGCLCSCHSQLSHRERVARTYLVQSDPKLSPTRSSTLPASGSSCSSSQQGIIVAAAAAAAANNNQVPARKVRRLKKLRGSSNSNELNREDIINLLADKLCENCYETHYWLHGCSSELMLQQPPKTTNRQDSSSSASASTSSASNNAQDYNGLVARRNATFIKLVQQEVRSTISKSIELIDLIRKEIKSPESIKQKQLMRCFSTSIQLLTSVGNYVVPTQDISTFIPEVGQQQTTLFSLPSSDFDHLLFYQPSHHQLQANLNYHLASAPDIPIRRHVSHLNSLPPFNGRIPERGNSIPSSGTTTGTAGQENGSSCGSRTEQALSSNLQRLKTSDTNADSSSGASSNNSSASSSIARGGVQQSSLTRAQTTSAILDGKTSHDLSFEVIANLSRQQSEDDNLFQSRPKFWQSSKFNFIKKLLHVKQQRLLRQQSKDRRIYNNKVQNKFRLVMMDLTHFNKSQQLLTTENGVNSLLTSMRNVLEFGLYLTLKLY